MKNIRLETVLSYINKEDKLADVGCDHGYLAIMALKKGVNFVQLIDNKEGPLASAKQNLALYDNQNNIEYSLSSGISQLNACVNTVAICGMGGELIAQILSDDLIVAKQDIKFILQPNSKLSYLRRFLSNNKFQILDENIVLDSGKVYEILVVKFNAKANLLSDKEILFGPILMKNKQDLFIQKWENKLKLNKKIISNLLDNDMKYQIIEKEIKIIEEVIYEN